MQELIIIRGPSGSGKSTFAYRLLESARDCEHIEIQRSIDGIAPKWMSYQWIEADHFFCHKPQNEEERKEAEEKDEQLHKYVYRFNPNGLRDAHAWCQRMVRSYLKFGESVIISNTFTRIWEMQPYLDMAKEFNARLTVLHMENRFGNVHGLSEEQVKQQRDRWEPYNG